MIARLKDGSQKFINDVDDLRELIYEKLGSDVEEEYLKIIEKEENQSKKIERLEADKKELQEEHEKVIEKLEAENSKLRKELYEYKDSFDDVKEILKSLQEEYDYNKRENEKILRVITSLRHNIW